MLYAVIWAALSRSGAVFAEKAGEFRDKHSAV
jgi:hypothetical protein